MEEIQESDFRGRLTAETRRRRDAKLTLNRRNRDTNSWRRWHKRQKAADECSMPTWARWITAALVCVMGLKTLQIGVRRDLTLECENTWSTSGYREWLGFLRTHQWRKPSTLEIFIRENYPTEFTNRWRRWHATPRNWLGQPICCSSRQPPENGVIVDQFITGLSDRDRKALYDFFRTADAEAAQNKVSNMHVHR